ncbi:sensor histidine kinase [Saccharothrix sp. S26]|uniref:sensor histidine kinase n=1 Tax=Saccharothrix sp. S26 TaxID=2907215 RepID=UPI001F42A4F8|nr:sensor histidine kinase [Saccharothrix sp. S26]MCE7000719.1 sensor histidine kinase [Saccharothrix sp. S26]
MVQARLGPRALLVVDAVAAAAVVVWTVLRAPAVDVPAVVLAVALGAPLAVRRRRPVAVLCAVLSVGATAIVVGVGNESVLAAVVLALHPVVLDSPRLDAPAAALGCVLAAGIAVATVPGLPLVPPRAGAESFATHPVTTSLFSAVVLIGAWAVAATVRTRRRHHAELVESRTARAVAEERLRIARDIHDVVGHNLSLIAMRAAVANHVADTRPDEREAALRGIEQVSRAALADVRTVLGGVREASADPASTAGLDRLVADARSAGVAVTTEQADLAGTPAAVRVSAYRIVQEALTNVRRHGHPPRCHLVTAVEPGRLVVSVVDEGTTVTGSGDGQGLLGMRERVALHGGTLHAGPLPGGGFAVRATLPFDTAARHDG